LLLLLLLSALFTSSHQNPNKEKYPGVFH